MEKNNLKYFDQIYFPIQINIYIYFELVLSNEKKSQILIIYSTIRALSTLLNKNI